MIDIQKHLEKIIKKALGELDIEADKIHLEHPVDLAMGDYSTNVAMVYAKKLGQNPKKFAEKIVEKINLDAERLSKSLLKVEVAGAGFINFYLSKKFFEENIGNILEAGEKYGNNENLKGKKIMVEYTDPNPFKEVHIGHLMSNAIGESISRIIEIQGAKIIRVNFQGDVGMHVAKAIYGLLKLGRDGFKIGDLAEAYSLGAKDFENNKDEITEINKKIYDRSDEKINKLYDIGREASLRYFEVIYKKLGTKFDEYFF